MLIFDFYAGTGSATQAFKDAGHTVISFELNPKQPATENVDVLTLNSADLLARYGRPVFVWASPPCTTFSVASIPKYWHYVDGVLTAKDEGVKLGIAMVKKAIELINELQPSKGWIIENPRGMLRKQGFMQELPRRTITYCQYGDFRQKPTDLWGTVSNWSERPPCKPGMSCHVSAPRGSTTGSQGLKTVERSMIPYELSKEILKAINADV
jgi:site-specific DNA-cytosine methylase